jgi:hypothetical protein
MIASFMKSPNMRKLKHACFVHYILTRNRDSLTERSSAPFFQNQNRFHN